MTRDVKTPHCAVGVILLGRGGQEPTRTNLRLSIKDHLPQDARPGLRKKKRFFGFKIKHS